MKRPIRPWGRAAHCARLAVVIVAIGFCAFQSAAFQCQAQSAEIKHIVIIVQESRSFDTMFGQLPGANGATTGDYLGQTVSLKQAPLSSDPLPDNYSVTKGIIDGGLDDFYYGNGNPEKSAYIQFSRSELPNYWEYAQNFAVADNFFASTYGASFANHLYLVAAQSGNAIGNPDSSVAWGCDSPAGTTVLLANGQKVFPCFTIPTLPGELNPAGITWQYYAAPKGQAGYIWSALDAIKGIRESSQWTTNVLPVNQFVANALSGTLANVVWVTPPQVDSDSPPANVCAGENWAVQMINAIMESPEWPSTAIFLTWSDYGGYYDHVAPPTVDSFGLSLRVPTLIISPYVKAGLVEHQQTEFSSLLASVEHQYGLPPLTARDAAANDLWDAFDFNQQALSPLILSAQKCSSSR
jgi:phospholipase C